METSCTTAAHRPLYRDLSIFILCVEIRNAVAIKIVEVWIVLV